MRRVVAVLVALLGMVVVAGCAPRGDGVSARPVNPECRGDADDPQPGDVICYTTTSMNR